MLYLSIIFFLRVVASAVTQSDSCLIQTCSASQGGDIVVAIYDAADPNASGQYAPDAVTNFLTSSCGLSLQITQCYVDCTGLYGFGQGGTYWTVENCHSQCGIPINGFSVNCGGYVAWFCSTAVSNVCQLAAPSSPTENPTATATGQTTAAATGQTTATAAGQINVASSGSGLTKGDKLATGISLVIGIPTLILGAYGLRYAIKQYNKP